MAHARDAARTYSKSDPIRCPRRRPGLASGAGPACGEARRCVPRAPAAGRPPGGPGQGADAPAITKTVAAGSFGISGASFVIAPHTTNQYVSEPNALTLSQSAPDTYQNASFDISLSVSGQVA
jgi:hypothetical protein